MKPDGLITDTAATGRRAMRLPAACWVAVMLGCLLCAHAQDASSTSLAQLKGLGLDQLLQVQVATVTAASGFEQTINEAPASISIVTAEEIKRYGYRTLADILQSLQGFNVSNDRNYAFLGTRGVSLGDFNSRILLLIDGHRVNNNLTDGAAIGTDFILDVDLIERVEVIRGPGSVLYGNNAFFGVINIITRKGSQVNGVEASGEYGSYDTYKARVSIGKAFTNGVEFLLSGTYYDSEGPDQLYYKEFDTPDQNNGIAQNMNGNSFESVFGSLSYEDFTLESAYINRENVNPTAQNFTTFNDSRFQTTDDRGYVDLKYAHSFPDVLDLTARLYYDWNQIKTGYPYGEPVASVFYNEVQGGEWGGAELQLSKRLWQKHTISIGAEYRNDFSQYDHVFDHTTTYTDAHATRQSYGVFAQGDFALRSDLHFNGGMRYDQDGDFAATYSPRLALIYTPFQQSTFKAIYGTAFRSPNFQELSDPRFQNIQPEQITSYELVYEQGIGQHLHSSVAGFYNQMHNLILFQDGHYENVNADTTGMELALEGKWSNGILGRTSYTFQNTENLSGGNDFPDSPEQLFKFNLSVPLLREKIFAGVEYQYTSSRETVYTSSSGMTVAGPNTPGFGIVNVTLFSQNLLKNLELSASVYNLLNTSYSDPSSPNHVQAQIPQDGRSFRVKLTYRF
jgi:outer membrane receptor for ferrienterochelin and colicins